MRFKPMVIWLLAFSISSSSLLAQDQNHLEATARAYFRAIEARDFAGQLEFYTDQSLFEDPTAEIMGTTHKAQGGEAIVALRREGAKNIPVWAFEIKEVLVSRPWVVLNLTTKMTLRSEVVGIPDKTFSVGIDWVSVLRIENGKILRHTDYAAYEDFMQALGAARQELERK